MIYQGRSNLLKKPVERKLEFIITSLQVIVRSTSYFYSPQLAHPGLVQQLDFSLAGRVGARSSHRDRDEPERAGAEPETDRVPGQGPERGAELVRDRVPDP